MIRPLLLAATTALLACGPIDPRPDGGRDGGDGGAPDGGDGGMGLPVTCESMMTWTSGNVGAEAMNPGLACRACHLGQNFQGQNPNLESNPQWAMFFMGTVYSDFNQANLCRAKGIPAGTVVEILDMAGAVKLSLPVDPSGNFRSTTVAATVPLPYRARVKANGQTRVMGAAQMDGDCNTCHTEQGRENAPGRVVLP